MVDTTESADEFEYDVFISYRTTISPDREVAEELQRVLEDYPIPWGLKSNIVSPGWFRHRLCVFRDTNELVACEDISAEIEENLQKSRWLLVVCTPSTLESEYCRKEIDDFRRLHGQERVLLLLVAGEPEMVLPPFSKELNKVPFAPDIRAGRNDTKKLIGNLQGVGVAKSEQAKFKLLAPILGCESPNDLVRRHRLHALKVYAFVAAAVTLVGIVIAVLLHQKQATEAEAAAFKKLGDMNVECEFIPHRRGYKITTKALDRLPPDIEFERVCKLLSEVRRPVISLTVQNGKMTTVAPIIEHGLLQIQDLDFSFSKELRDIDQLHKLKELNSLAISFAPVDDKEFASFVKWAPHRLRLLHISGTSITNEGLDEASNHFVAIDELGLSGTKVSVDGLAGLKNVRIKRLKLKDMPESFKFGETLVDTLKEIPDLKYVEFRDIDCEGGELVRDRLTGTLSRINIEAGGL